MDIKLSNDGNTYEFIIKRPNILARAINYATGHAERNIPRVSVDPAIIDEAIGRIKAEIVPTLVNVNEVIEEEQEETTIEAEPVDEEPAIDYDKVPEVRPHTDPVLAASYSKTAVRKFIKKQNDIGSKASKKRKEDVVTMIHMLLDNYDQETIANKVGRHPSNVGKWKRRMFPNLPSGYVVGKKTESTETVIKPANELDNSPIVVPEGSRFGEYLNLVKLDVYYKKAVGGTPQQKNAYTSRRLFIETLLELDDLEATIAKLGIKRWTAYEHILKFFPGATKNKELMNVTSLLKLKGADDEMWRTLDITKEDVRKHNLNCKAIKKQWDVYQKGHPGRAGKRAKDKTFRMGDFLRMHISGKNSDEIAKELGVSLKVIEDYRNEFINH